MSSPLPYSDFVWISEEELNCLTANNYEAIRKWKRSNKGLTLEVDLHIPESIHDETSDYPLLPDKIAIDNEMISPTSSKILENKKLAMKMNKRMRAEKLQTGKKRKLKEIDPEVHKR